MEIFRATVSSPGLWALRRFFSWAQRPLSNCHFIYIFYTMLSSLRRLGYVTLGATATASTLYLADKALNDDLDDVLTMFKPTPTEEGESDTYRQRVVCRGSHLVLVGWLVVPREALFLLLLFLCCCLTFSSTLLLGCTKQPSTTTPAIRQQQHVPRESSGRQAGARTRATTPSFPSPGDGGR